MNMTIMSRKVLNYRSKKGRNTPDERDLSLGFEIENKVSRLNNDIST